MAAVFTVPRGTWVDNGDGVVRRLPGGAYSKVGRTQEAIALLEGLVADSVRTLRPHHPDTLDSQAALAICYRKERRLAAALTVLTQMAGASIRARWNRGPR